MLQKGGDHFVLILKQYIFVDISEQNRTFSFDLKRLYI